MEKCCKNCQHLDVPNDRLGRRIVRRDTNYKCMCPLPELPPMPEWLNSWKNQLAAAMQRTQHRVQWGEDGTQCEIYQERQK